VAEQIVDQNGRVKPKFEALERELRSGWLKRVGAGDVLRGDEEGQ
jgi:hypothetical protein